MVLTTDILMGWQDVKRLFLLLVEEHIQPTLYDLFDGLVVVDPVEAGPLDCLDQPSGSHLLFQGENAHTALIRLFGIDLLLQNKSDVVFNLRANPFCPGQELLRLPFRYKAV